MKKNKCGGSEQDQSSWHATQEHSMMSGRGIGSLRRIEGERRRFKLIQRLLVSHLHCTDFCAAIEISSQEWIDRFGKCFGGFQIT